jgi:hypothetical protein
MGLTIGDCGLPMGLMIANLSDDGRLAIRVTIGDSIPNRQPPIKSPINNPLANPQSPIVNAIGSLQSALGNG